jgi:hypothetical protein
MRTIYLLLLIVSTSAYGQLTKQDSIWLPFKSFLGTWNGDSEGQPGKGRYERSYQMILNNKFIEVRNRSTYPPSTENPKGEVHEDIGYISYDRARKTFVLRQFHVEGFVNQYKIELMSSDGKTIVFISESIENVPKGFQAKETYNVINENQFNETFEIAEPGKPFGLYSKATLTKVK